MTRREPAPGAALGWWAVSGDQPTRMERNHGAASHTTTGQPTEMRDTNHCLQTLNLGGLLGSKYPPPP